MHVGGMPLALDELREQYVRQSRGRSLDETQSWCNWVIRKRSSLEAVGYVQATVDNASRSADVAWVVGVRYQRCGFASEAATAMVSWLRDNGVVAVTAHVHPAHLASSAVAAAAGLLRTSTVIDGEIRWER